MTEVCILIALSFSIDRIKDNLYVLINGIQVKIRVEIYISTMLCSYIC